MFSKTLLTLSVIAAMSIAAVSFADVAPVADASVNNAAPAATQPDSNANTMPTLAQPQSASDASDDSSATTDNSSMTDEQRIGRLEQQIKNLTKLNSAQQISDMQDQIQSLSGQVQVQKKLLNQLSKQQRDFYQEVDSRITQLNTLVNSSSSKASNAHNTGPVTSAPTASTSNTAATAPATTTPAAAPASAANKQKELDAYQSAFSLVLSKNLKGAETGLYHYLSAYPNGRYVANAHYWLGEIALQDKDYLAAQKQFSVIVSQFPKNQKVADARLKLATIAEKLGQTGKAIKAFQAIVKDYPQSPTAQLAQVQLTQLQKSP
jgi:tol-pal system protein YbgF